VGDELQRRIIKEGVVCLAYHREESLKHWFWDCPHSTAMWEVARSLTSLPLQSPDCPVRRHSDLHGWVLDWLGSMEEKELGLAIMLIYQMWLARNEARDAV
jgi:hypothetical protein